MAGYELAKLATRVQIPSGAPIFLFRKTLIMNMKQFKIIDVNTHPSFLEGDLKVGAKKLGIDFTLDGMLKDLKKHNIYRAVAMPRFSHNHLGERILHSERNDEIIQIVKAHPEKFLGVATLQPNEFVEDDLKVIEQGIKRGYFKALKLYLGYEYFYPNSEECLQIYEFAQKMKVPVFFHTGDSWGKFARVKYAHPLAIDDVGCSFPKVKFVICHLGNPWIADATEVICKNENVFADLSGIVYNNTQYRKEYEKAKARQISEAIYFDDSIIDKVMFGTDYPLTDYAPYIKFISKLDIEKKDFRKIFFENARKMFGLKEK